MNPCHKFRQDLALLAWEGLPRANHQHGKALMSLEREQVLRTHLKLCAHCGQYLADVTRLVARLGAATDSLRECEVSDVCHRRIVSALRTAQPESRWSKLAGLPAARWLDWRVALPVSGLAALALAVLLRLQTDPPVAAPNFQTAATRTESLPAPSLSEYMLVANRSLDQLDDLITRQGKQNLPPAPTFTPSAPDGL